MADCPAFPAAAARGAAADCPASPAPGRSAARAISRSPRHRSRRPGAGTADHRAVRPAAASADAGRHLRARGLVVARGRLPRRRPADGALLPCPSSSSPQRRVDTGTSSSGDGASRSPHRTASPRRAGDLPDRRGPLRPDDDGCGSKGRRPASCCSGSGGARERPPVTFGWAVLREWVFKGLILGIARTRSPSASRGS